MSSTMWKHGGAGLDLDELGSELTDNSTCHLNGTDSLHDGIDRYTNKYDISNRCETLREQAM